MANGWLRLWHDMPNDPKWRTIARVSKQPITAVLSVYVHLLVIASNATERGRTQNVCSEDIASALDLNAEQVDGVLAAMQGRVLDGDIVRGWAKRQVEREDGSAERAKRWREAQKDAKQTQPNATERNRTPDTDTDTDTDKNIRITTSNEVVVDKPSLPTIPADESTTQDESEDADNGIPPCPQKQIIVAYHKALPMCVRVAEWTPAQSKMLRTRWREKPERQCMEWWEWYFECAAKSKFLTGRVSPTAGRPPFLASLKFLVKPEKMSMLLQGEYNRE